jgi:hypothetical protein
MSDNRTDRQRMNAAFRAMRTHGIDARHTAADLREHGVRLSVEPADLYGPDGSLHYVRVSWVEGAADSAVVLACLRDEGLLCAPLPTVPAAWGDPAIESVQVAANAAVLAETVALWTDDVASLSAAMAGASA